MALYNRKGATTYAPLTQIQWAPTLFAHDPNPPFPLETSTGVVDFNYTPAGGGVGGGTTGIVWSFNESPAGGTTGSGVQVLTNTWARAPTGGAAGNGTAPLTVSWAEVPVGGATLDGIMAFVVAVAQGPAGGVAPGGITDAIYLWTPIASGGAAADGGVGLESIFVWTAVGAMIGGGLTDYDFEPGSTYFNYDCSGGGLLGGVVDYDLAVFPRIVGGLVVTGHSHHVAYESAKPVTTCVVTCDVVYDVEVTVQNPLLVTILMEARLYVGQSVRSKVTFRRDGILFDPSSIRLTCGLPTPTGGRQRLVWDYGPSAIVRESTGIYTYTFVPVVMGRYSFMWESMAPEEICFELIQVNVKARPRAT